MCGDIEDVTKCLPTGFNLSPYVYKKCSYNLFMM